MEYGGIVIVLKIVGTIYCVSQAGEKGRSKFGWGIFGFFAPIIASIWISCLGPNK